VFIPTVVLLVFILRTVLRHLLTDRESSGDLSLGSPKPPVQPPKCGVIASGRALPRAAHPLFGEPTWPVKTFIRRRLFSRKTRVAMGFDYFSCSPELQPAKTQPPPLS
jgi:hypothetical protein